MPQNSRYYQIYDPFFIAVDCIIFGFKQNQLKLLVRKRQMEPLKGGLSLMGGFVSKDESLHKAAVRVLTDLTGLEDIYMEQVGTYGEVDRDPGERVISCAYYALIDVDAHEDELLKKYNAAWLSIDKAKELIFDHTQMVNDAIKILRRKASVEPIGLNLLSEKFTLTQLQLLYEAIYGHSLDKRNFRKKILSLNFLEKTDEIDKSGSKKGAYLYKFVDNQDFVSEPRYNF